MFESGDGVRTAATRHKDGNCANSAAPRPALGIVSAPAATDCAFEILA
jgi:hypothetical protein